jgi:hypothetical protein
MKISMKYKFIFRVALSISISAPILISSSTVRAQKFVGASYQSQYFHRGGTIYYLKVRDDNSRSYCGFASPGHLTAYRSVVAGNVNYGKPPSNTGSYYGSCGLVFQGYFSHGGTTYFVNEGFCGFSNSQSYHSHRRANPKAHNYGLLDVDPRRIMEYRGTCGRG